MAKIRSSLYKLSILTGKWYKIKATQQLCTFCNQRTIENEFHFLLDCPNYEELRKGTFNSVAKIDNIDLKHGYKIKRLKQMFSVGKFINDGMKKGNKTTMRLCHYHLIKSTLCKESKKHINKNEPK